MKQNFLKEKQWNIVLLVFVLLSSIAAVSKIFIGFDIDEAYAVSMPYRFLQNDRLFTDMWEVHQTSSFLPYVWIAAFVKLTGQNTYLVLFLRIVATVIHGVLAVVLYRIAHTHFGRGFGAFLALLYFNFLPKWMSSLDFSMQQLWFLTLSILFLYLGLYQKKKYGIFFSGIFLACGVLAYPGMVFAYPFILWSIWKLTPQECSDDRNKEQKYKNKSRFNNCILLTMGCTIIAAVFFCYLFSYMSVSELLENIPMVFSDGSHQYDLATKVSIYLKQWLEVAVQSAILLIPAAVLTLIVQLLGRKSKKAAMSTLTVFTMLFLLLSSGITVFANVLGISWGPFRLQVRYLILFVLGFLLYHRICKYSLSESQTGLERKLAKGVFWLLMIPSLGSFIGVLLASNVGPVSSASYLVIANIACVILLMLWIQLGLESFVHQIHIGILFLFLLSLIMCKGYYVRVTEYAPGNILEERMQISEGPAKGIWVYPEDYKRIMTDYMLMDAGVASGEKILFMGTESLNNLTAVSKASTFVSPTTISTPAFNEQWTTYFEEHKEKQPDVIFIAKNTIDNREKFFAQNDFGQWIAKHYNVEDMIDTQYLCIIRK